MTIVMLAASDIQRLAADQASPSSLPGMVVLVAGLLVLISARALGSVLKALFVTFAILLGLIATVGRLLAVLMLCLFLVAAVLLNTGASPDAPIGDPSVSTQVQ